MRACMHPFIRSFIHSFNSVPLRSFHSIPFRYVALRHPICCPYVTPTLPNMFAQALEPLLLLLLLPPLLLLLLSWVPISYPYLTPTLPTMLPLRYLLCYPYVTNNVTPIHYLRH